MNPVQTQRATLDDLYRYPDKGELIGGRIVPQMASGLRPNRVAGRIFRSLDDYADKTRRGLAFTDNMGFGVPELPSGRESFSPDAAYYEGQLPANRMRFISGPPTLAVEVRSENDYKPSAEEDQADKRTDYFAAGTEVVWDVDTLNERIHIYRRSNPTQHTTYGRGQEAEAEPAVPGWKVSVDWIFA